uniref:Elevenin n=1 Tax=Cacopsylla melanoneura TaxID=428564 RepID=A0A8D8YZK9_9HEMI
MKASLLMWYNSICIFTLMLFMLEVGSQQINCRKYVFAPLCRGVAAKRGEAPPSLLLPASNDQRNSIYETDEDNDVIEDPDSLDYSWDKILAPLRRKSKLLLGKTKNAKFSDLGSKNKTHKPKLLYVYDYEK